MKNSSLNGQLFCALNIIKKKNCTLNIFYNFSFHIVSLNLSQVCETLRFSRILLITGLRAFVQNHIFGNVIEKFESGRSSDIMEKYYVLNILYTFSHSVQF